MRHLKGVIVDFHTLYDPLALSGVILSYIPTYEKIYVSSHSLWLRADSCTGHGYVPIDGFNLLKNDFNHWGIKWLRNWCEKNLGISDQEIVKENLCASLILIKKLMQVDLFKILPSDEFIQIGSKMVSKLGLSSGTLWDCWMPFGEDKENGFYLSPDLGHSYLLGIGVVVTGKNDFRFSTNNPIIKKGIEDFMYSKFTSDKLEILKGEFVNEIEFFPPLTVREIFNLLDKEKEASGFARFVKEMESMENDFIFFTPETYFDPKLNRLTIKFAYTAYKIRTSL